MANISCILISILFYYFIRLISVRSFLAVSFSVINYVKCCCSLGVFRSRRNFSYNFESLSFGSRFAEATCSCGAGEFEP